MGRVEKTVFISYRRTNLPWALAIYQELTHNGYDVFFDYLSIPSGDFENIIVENIKARAHFVVILTPSALERCNEPGDWLRREIETAMDEKRNIVPLMLESFDFGSSSTINALTGKLENLKKYSGLCVHSEYFFEGMTRLREQYLNVSLDAIIHPISIETQPVTKEHQTAASEAEQVNSEQLSAIEWFERGIVSYRNNLHEEAVRCFSEAIRLKPDFSEAYNNRANEYLLANSLDRAITDYSKAIKFQPLLADAHYNRGVVYRVKGRFEDSIADFHEAFKIKPDYALPRISLIAILKKLGREVEANQQEKSTRELVQNEAEYDRACFESICGNKERALQLLKIAFRKKPSTKEWAKKDLDLENIRNDPRFKKLVGE